MEKKKLTLGKKVLIGIGVLALIGMIGNAVDPVETSPEKNAQNDSIVKASEAATAKQEAEEKRKKDLEQGFSAWDGSHKALVKLVKANMNDPESFDHVETKYWDLGSDTLVVLMQYRGKNAFGGVVTESIKARANINGDVIEIMQ